MIRSWVDLIFRRACLIATLISVFLLAVLLWHIFKQGHSVLSWNFFQNYPSRFSAQAGIRSAFYGTIWVMICTAISVVPLGILTAVFLEEYMPRKSIFLKILKLNISSLAGMPSVVYGLLGLALFVRMSGMGRSIIAGSLTMSLLILPVIIIASTESIRAVPNTLREAALALGASKWQVIWGQVLPAAMPGIMTGTILALSRAIGETAPLIMIGALSYVAFIPHSLWDSFTVLPVQIFNWAARPQPEFHAVAAGAIIVVLVLLLSLNGLAIIIRQRFQKYRL
ncbi:MAG: phosphate ABC transporter permease PstA [Proteobacteria bacterium]|nr:phosphate ABC transporter permease PstA [Pseudomonadota bacterium]